MLLLPLNTGVRKGPSRTTSPTGTHVRRSRNARIGLNYDEDAQATARCSPTLMMAIDATCRKLQIVFSGTGSFEDDLFMKSNAADRVVDLIEQPRHQDQGRAHLARDGCHGRQGPTPKPHSR
jgi:hypothetical protein